MSHQGSYVFSEVWWEEGMENIAKWWDNILLLLSLTIQHKQTNKQTKKREESATTKCHSLLGSQLCIHLTSALMDCHIENIELKSNVSTKIPRSYYWIYDGYTHVYGDFWVVGIVALRQVNSWRRLVDVAICTLKKMVQI